MFRRHHAGVAAGRARAGELAVLFQMETSLYLQAGRRALSSSMSAMYREMKLRRGSADFMGNIVTDLGPINVLRLFTWLSPALARRKPHAIVMRGEDGVGLRLHVSSVYVHSDAQRILGFEKKKKRTNSIHFTQPDLWAGSMQGVPWL